MSSTSLPPGLDGNFTTYIHGGNSAEWMEYKGRKTYTNVFLVMNGKLLLGYKKRGFGTHRYNGFGGKVEPGETPVEAAARELQEEAGIQAPLKHAGTLLFVSEGIEYAFQIEIYRAETYTGIITETEEMRPQWFTLPSETADLDVLPDPEVDMIPFDKMWDADRFWIPLLLANRHFVGRTDFRRQGEKFELLRWWFGLTSDFASIPESST